MAARAKICTRNLSFAYEDKRDSSQVQVLRDVSIDIEEKEFFCVLGPSGCGKSTLLYLVAGLLRPNSPNVLMEGELLVDGTPIKGPGADRGVVFQEYALMPWKTVRENVALGPKIRSVPKRERLNVAQHYIDLVNLSGFEDKYPHELSGGMRQRVAVARTLANSPDIILMDEPFAAVDAQTRLTLQEELVSIWEKDRKTIIFITHNIDEAVFLGDRVLVMTPRPARVREIVTVDIPRDARDWETMQRSDRFHELVAEVSSLIRTRAARG